MKRIEVLLTLSLVLITSCNAVTPTTAPSVLTLEYTPATSPWMADIYACSGTTLIKADQMTASLQDPLGADFVLRLGASSVTTPAYQIGTDEIMVIVNPANLVHLLSSTQVLGLFTGQIQDWQEIGGSDSPVKIWAYATSDDIQSVFDQIALGGNEPASTVRLAAGPQEMLQAIAADKNAVGILNARLMANSVTRASTITSVPVLVLTASSLPETSKDILACLQH